MSLQVLPITCLRDNYAYLVRWEREAWVVDPSEPGPVLARLDAEGLILRGILATHHHADHVAGIPGVLERAPGTWVACHEFDLTRIPGATLGVPAPTTGWYTTTLRLGPAVLQARHMPGHTLGAVGWRLHRLPRLHVTQGQPAGEDPDDVFTGDTLFGAGCGRLFEGSAAQLHTSLAALLELPDATRLWFGHEYTASNLRFARTVAPDDAALLARERCLTPCTTPTTVALERATNPFARAPTASHLASLRHAKDNF